GTAAWQFELAFAFEEAAQVVIVGVPTSVSVPKLVTPSVTPAMEEVPDLVIFPLARGEVAVGLTWIPCQVSVLGTPPVLFELMVMVMVVAVTVGVMVDPSVRSLIFLVLSATFPFTFTVTPVVLNLNPAGAFRTIVPATTAAVAG